MTSDRGHLVTRSISRRAAVLGVLLGVAWLIVVLAWAPPYRITCDPAVPRDVCLETVNAGLSRGLPRFRPLILDAHVAPGPAFPTGHGHRATVTYSLLPGPSTDVRLFFDAGGHWGGVSSASDVELALWAGAPVGVLVLAGALVAAAGTRVGGRVSA